MSEKRIASHFPVLDRLGLGLVRTCKGAARGGAEGAQAPP